MKNEIETDEIETTKNAQKALKKNLQLTNSSYLTSEIVLSYLVTNIYSNIQVQIRYQKEVYN